MKKHAQLLTLALIAAASILFGMVLASGVKLTPASLADSGMQGASLRPPVQPAGGVASPGRLSYPSQQKRPKLPRPLRVFLRAGAGSPAPGKAGAAA